MRLSGRCLAAIALLFSAPVLPQSASFAQEKSAANNGFGSTWGHPQKVFRFAIEQRETGFDPAQVSDVYSGIVVGSIFDPLLQYDHLARPAKVRVKTAQAMPDISADGVVYTFRVRPGIYFQDDPAFNGQKRELVAKDYEYAIRRHLDPKNKSQNAYHFEQRLIGAAESTREAVKVGKYDYDKPIEGIEVLDRYTIRFKLKKADYNFLFVFAYWQFGAVAREVVEKYGEEIMAHPVGTGPFKLTFWKRGSRIVLEANPGYREEVFDAEPAADDALGRQILADMKGKRLPQVGRVEIVTIEERQPRWLAFLNEETDAIERLSAEYMLQAAPGGKLSKALAERGVVMDQYFEHSITYTSFNMDAPVVGGYTPEKVALRRAMAMGFDQDKEVIIYRKGQARSLGMPMARGAFGYDPNFRVEAFDYNPARANALLDTWGYKDVDGDGWRENPDGSPLVITLTSPPELDYRELDDIWKTSMDAIGIRMNFRKENWSDSLKASNLGKLQMWALAWQGGHPDAEAFFNMLYGPHIGGANRSRFKLAAFDQLYERSRATPIGPERDPIYKEMTRLFAIYMPWRLGVNRIQSNFSHPWVKGYRLHPMWRSVARFVDIDLAKIPANQRAK